MKMLLRKSKNILMKYPLRIEYKPPSIRGLFISPFISFSFNRILHRKSEDLLRQVPPRIVQTVCKNSNIMKNKHIKLGDNRVKEIIEVQSLFSHENNTIQIVQRQLIHFLVQMGYGVYSKTSKFLNKSVTP